MGGYIYTASDAFCFVFFIGLRAAMGAGYSRMNDLTIIQTTQVKLYSGSIYFLYYLVVTLYIGCSVLEIVSPLCSLHSPTYEHSVI